MSNTQNSILDLKEHQQEAYNNVEKLHQNGRYAAVVLPTGTGKSFVTLKLIQEHPDSKILFLSPRHAINLQMYKYIVRYIGGRADKIEDIYEEFGSIGNSAKSFIPGIETMLYQTIMGMANKGNLNYLFEKIKPDYIVLDEVHHIKTRKIKEKYVVGDEDEIEQKEDENIWGRGIKQLLDKYPDAKVLGLSATPIRTDGADVVERLFKDSIAYEMTLLEAIETGLIKPPKYVVPDFVKSEELETLLEKIEKAEGQRKIELKEVYDQLVEASSKAPGIPEIMEENITEKNGKYIVFCKDLNDMQEKMQQAQEWFGKINENQTMYRVSSKHTDSKKQLEEFNADNSDRLKLMYCVGMISEGVHINGVSGVVLTSKVGSKIDFLQKIGRTITISDSDRETLVVDLTNSNEVLSQELNGQKSGLDDIEALRELVEWVEKNDGKTPDYENYQTYKEKAMFLRFKRLNNKYYKYVENTDLLDLLDEEEREKYEEIISLGESIGLFDEYIQVENEEQLQETCKDLNKFLEEIKIKGVRKEFLKILKESEIQKNAYEELIEWLETHDGKMPKKGFSEKGKTKTTNQLTEEEKGEVNLYARWRRSEEYRILQNYVEKDISEVPEEYREKIAKLRSFDLGLKLKGKKEKLKEVIEDRDVAKELNEETRELEHQVSDELNKMKGKLKI
jgi:superfamily II DNA or RNA helicase